MGSQSMEGIEFCRHDCRLKLELDVFTYYFFGGRGRGEERKHFLFFFLQFPWGKKSTSEEIVEDQDDQSFLRKLASVKAVLPMTFQGKRQKSKCVDNVSPFIINNLLEKQEAQVPHI